MRLPPQLCKCCPDLSRKLVDGVRRAITGFTAASYLVALRLLDRVAPTERIVELSALNALQVVEQLDAQRPGLIALDVLELVVCRLPGNRLDGDQCSSGSCSQNFAKTRQLLIGDLPRCPSALHTRNFT